MPSPYSQDLREKALGMIDEEHSVTEVARLLGLSRSVLNAWRKRARETGSCAAKSGYQKGHSHKIQDWEAFKSFVEEHGGKTHAEMAQLWSEQSTESVSARTIGRALKRIGVTRKKRRTSSGKEVSSNDSYTGNN